MEVNWPENRFEDLLAEPLRNGIYKKKEFHGRGSRIVNMGELFCHPRLFDTEMKRVQLTEKEKQKSLLRNGDLIFARRSLTAEGAGKCSIVKDVPEETTFESSIIRARPDPNRANSDFLYYFFSSPGGKYLIGSILRQVAVAGITGSDLKELPIVTPTIDEQKSIAHILSTIDDKIELNRKMNTTLEDMAQALFKSWFVDFDPVIDKALEAGNPIPERLQKRAKVRQALGDKRKPLPSNIARHFPDGFVITEELCWVPEGWELKSFSTLTNLDTTSVKPFEQPETVWEHYSIPSYDSSGMPSRDKGDEIKSNKYRVKAGAILSSKLNPETERTWWPHLMDENASICSTEFMQFVPHQVEEQAFVYSLIRSEPFQANILERVTGSTGSRQRAQPKQVAEIDIIDCDEVLREEYIKVALPLFQLNLNNSLESQSLSSLRDTLLPKLLSGELQIPDAEKLIEAV